MGLTGRGPGARNAFAVLEMAWYTSGLRVVAGPGRLNSPRAQVFIDFDVSKNKQTKASEKERTCSSSSSSSFAAATLVFEPLRTSSMTLVCGLRRNATWTPSWRVRLGMVRDSVRGQRVRLTRRIEEDVRDALGERRRKRVRSSSATAVGRWTRQHQPEHRNDANTHTRSSVARSWPRESFPGRPCGTRGRGWSG